MEQAGPYEPEGKKFEYKAKEKKRPLYTNRLINEKSPYLLQHAHNPVDWYPWGDEAFLAAKNQDKPIFLSIGYATCHWCHVMEEESFEDELVARAINETFIPIKIDREEMPEVDALYMEFAQAMIVGSAGWPLNLVLTPELKPIFAATYLPKNTGHGLVGMTELSLKIQELWKSDDRERLLSQSEKIVDILRAHVHVMGTELPGAENIQKTAEILFKIADPVYGGMRGAPKFPLGYQALFLLHFFLRTQDARGLFLVEKTLEMMHRGGIYDHLGGGFARYSVDEKWQIPHFEKMLYDNALLATSYLETWRVTGRAIYRQVCEEILDYVLSQMTDKEGGFYSAQDADSDGVEGLFYTFRPEEVISALGKEEGLFFCDFYGITEEGNFDGRSLPFMEYSLEEFAEMRGMPQEECVKILNKAKKALFKVREKRSAPFKDDKIITCWNAMMIESLAKAGFYLKNEVYLNAATKAAQFLMDHMWKDEGGGKNPDKILFRRFRDGEVRYRATLDDYAFLIQALLTLFEVGAEKKWLEWAIELAAILETQFKAENGAFYQTDGKDTNLLVRKCHYSDGAEPSGNAVHAENLLRLYQITFNKNYLKQAEDIFKAAKRYIDAYSLGYCYHLLALQRYYDDKKATLLVRYNETEELKDEIRQVLAHKVIPHYVLIQKRKNESLDALLPFTKNEGQVSDKTTLTICHEGVCGLPIVGKDEIMKALKDM